MIDDVRSFAVTGSGRRLNPSGTENREEREEKEGCDERRERDLECRIVHNTVCEYTTLHYSTVGVIMYRFLLSSSCRLRVVIVVSSLLTHAHAPRCQAASVLT